MIGVAVAFDNVEDAMQGGQLFVHTETRDPLEQAEQKGRLVVVVVWRRLMRFCGNLFVGVVVCAGGGGGGGGGVCGGGRLGRALTALALPLGRRLLFSRATVAATAISAAGGERRLSVRCGRDTTTPTTPTSTTSTSTSTPPSVAATGQRLVAIRILTAAPLATSRALLASAAAAAVASTTTAAAAAASASVFVAAAAAAAVSTSAARLGAATRVSTPTARATASTSVPSFFSLLLLLLFVDGEQQRVVIVIGADVRACVERVCSWTWPTVVVVSSRVS